MKMLSRFERKEAVSYDYKFNDLERPGTGLSFSCDEHGNIQERDKKLFEECLQEVKDGFLEDRGVIKTVWTYPEYARGLCDDCGREIVLDDNLTNECECGALYNFSGQRLAPRNQWEESEYDDDPGVFDDEELFS